MPLTPRAVFGAAAAVALSLWLYPGSLLAEGPRAEQPSATALLQIRAVEQDGGTVVEMWADGTIPGYRHFSLPDPPRLVIDFPGLRSELDSHLIPVGNAQVKRVRVGDHDDKLRVVVEVEDALLSGARLARAERGVALVLGDAETPDLTHAPALADVDTAPNRASRSPEAATLGGDAGAQLSRAAQDLAVAARELSAAVRELKEARLAAAPAPTDLHSTDRAAAELETSAREVERVARREPSPRNKAPDAAGAGASLAAATMAERVAAAPPPAVSAPAPTPAPAAAPTLATSYAHTYEGVLRWMRENRGVAPSFKPGDVIHRDELSKLRPFVPPGYYEEFDFPGATYKMQATTSHAAHEVYQQATLQYQGQTSLAPDGAVLNYVAGKPFSEERIRDAAPRDGGLMVAWNNIYRWQHYGYKAGPIPMAFITPGQAVPSERANALVGGGNVERVLVVDYQRVYLSHLAELADQNYTVAVADAESQHFKDWMEFTEPFDMRGMAFVFERFRDPHEPDQVNSYMPMERKVRRLSAKERADSFLGSEMTMDDFEGFSGRVLDYEWKYIGQKEVLHVADTGNPHPVFFGPMSHVPKDRWQVRNCHVVESRPVLPSHPYARKLTFYDTETYNIPMTLAFDAEDRLLKVIYTIYRWPGGGPADDPSTTVSHYQSSVVINKQSGRSLVNWSEATEIPEMKASTIRRLFNVSTLTGGR